VSPTSLVYKSLSQDGLEPIDDVQNHPDFRGKRFVQVERVRSCLVVPLGVAQKRVGVVFVNYRRAHRFEEDEVNDITLFANQAAITIRNTRLFDEREKMRGVVAGQMALAWLGMIDSTSGHRTQNFATTIRNEAEDLTAILLPKPKTKWTQEQRTIAESLHRIRGRAGEILAQRLAVPRLDRQEVESIGLFQELKKWADLRRTHEKSSTVLRGPESIEAELNVRISPVWLSRALEILVDNAIAATMRKERALVTLSVNQQGRLAVISVRDNGSGIPEALLEKLFREAAPMRRHSRGSGVGLLIVQAIAQTYRGEIRVANTGPSGTTMEFSLPLDEPVG